MKTANSTEYPAGSSLARFIVSAWLVLFAGPAIFPPELLGQPSAPINHGRRELHKRIAALIDKLGDDEFAVRERAEKELAGLGLAALDALAEAQFDDDVEIAVRARRLLRSIQVRWVSDHDPKPVRQILSGYGGLSADRRRDVIDRLAHVPHAEGLVALARIARFEPSHRTAKYAALAFLKAATPPREEISKVEQAVLRMTADSHRTSVSWLRAALRIWHAPETRVEEWGRLVDREESTFAIHPAQSGRALLRQLLLAYVDVLEGGGRSQAAHDTAARLLPLVNDERAQLTETADWLLDHGWYDLMESLYGRFHDGFEQHVPLMFRLAEARRRSGRSEEANQVAAAVTDRQAVNGSKALWLLGMSLQNDGFFHWAEYVYRKIIDVEDPQWSEICRVHITAAEMLHDLQRDDDAAELLQRLVDAAEDKKVRSVIERETRQTIENLAARATFFEACHYRSQKDYQREYEALQRAFAIAPRDVDVLIGLYRAGKHEPERLKEARAAVAAAVTAYRDRIEANKKRILQLRSRLEKTQVEMEVAQDCNQVAWLIANTEGDIDWAIDCSRESLTYYPDSSGFRDTLARCYFAKGDIARAVEEQRRAVAAEPHSPTLQAQLEVFLAAQRKNAEQR